MGKYLSFRVNCTKRFTGGNHSTCCRDMQHWLNNNSYIFLVKITWPHHPLNYEELDKSRNEGEYANKKYKEMDKKPACPLLSPVTLIEH